MSVRRKRLEWKRYLLRRIMAGKPVAGAIETRAALDDEAACERRHLFPRFDKTAPCRRCGATRDEARTLRSLS